jgi:hypothetical protein
MTLQSSGPIDLGQIQTEFSGSNPIGIDEYYRNGVYVTSNNTRIPTSGTISLQDFYGAFRFIPVPGCTNPSATNYNPSANQDDGSCTFIVRGCTNPSAINYNPSANQNDGSCRFQTIYTRIPLNRYVNPSTGDHYCSTSLQFPGYISEGQICTVFSSQAPGTVGLIDDDDDDGSSSGRPFIGPGFAGFGYKTQPSNPNVQPIYALTNGTDTLWSVSTSEGPYQFLRIEFYAPTQDLTVIS